ncbi:LysM peptidoglycan-binding domain-containing protein [Catellatospora sichuanensis]|uniref:LysM peptidoglycan-binding domain-containing protein n=1 Tax=Catellatospora sichuanensis TaxID=1969805 RepID=UPI0011836217|nr:LysM domain-containing protein [Catellatospora sichuanensis]
MSEPQDKEGRLDDLEHEAAGFMNPFKWGKKKKEEEEAKKAQEAQAQAQAQAAPPQAAPAPAAPPPAAPPPAAPPITEPAAAPKPAAPAAAAKPAAPTPKAPPAPKAERTYKVKSGDTLWDIAAQYYGDGRQYMKIAKANNIANPNMINVGVVLKIPD